MENFVFDQKICKRYGKSLETNPSKKKTSNAEVHEKYLLFGAKRGYTHSVKPLNNLVINQESTCQLVQTVWKYISVYIYIYTIVYVYIPYIYDVRCNNKMTSLHLEMSCDWN